MISNTGFEAEYTLNFSAKYPFFYFLTEDILNFIYSINKNEKKYILPVYANVKHAEFSANQRPVFSSTVKRFDPYSDMWIMRRAAALKKL